MTETDVVRVVDLLADAGVQIWVDGGWGVDALLHKQTRSHNDLDIVLRHNDVERFMGVMTAAGYDGYRLDPGGGPMNFIVFDHEHKEVDVHLVELSSTHVDAKGSHVYGPLGLAYEVGCLEGRGFIGGREVACCTAAYQIKSHSGYELDEIDLADVTALREQFGLSSPDLDTRP